MILNWKVSKEEHDLIEAIARRAKELSERQGVYCFQHEIMMDLTACHANGNSLDLAGLVAADDYDFTHDVWGIRQHLDRETGQLKDCFVPRYSAPEAK